ncbi:ubiquinol oxidase subunit II [Lichenicola cladoniae]|uniref:Ubiquinol oxidase subunit 2 n=1 Tax=Lichenicola cladoniae TaxID=1484109 RepID=A0A6M8HR09_9PROT|nr:ubiquinol oxidase subunit II [Lichenicola cladoniae]NPD69099.1 ubiquinol oxidase subunit II [Acetobacteraceae bacterium]QKE90923.1 ubiquinol oxidase subunit II [Lichenicola cladoniae]
MRTKRLPPLPGALALAALTMLTGCKYSILDPKGAVGMAQKSLILTSTYAMLVIVIPVIILTLWFAWRYREGAGARYEPDWAHSSIIEIFCWGIPCAIILFLGVLTWTSTHELDPYRPLVSSKKPINIEVVALDWKWLFIYPDQGIATINEIAFPVNTPVTFHITSDAVMNSFFIPELGSQIYAMAGMKTQLHLIANQQGTFPGLSSFYSGRGFSDMHFNAISTTDAKFADWVANAKKSPAVIDAADYSKVAAPEEKAPVRYFSTVEPNLFNEIIAKYLGKAESFHSGMKE